MKCFYNIQYVIPYHFIDPFCFFSFFMRRRIIQGLSFQHQFLFDHRNFKCFTNIQLGFDATKSKKLFGKQLTTRCVFANFMANKIIIAIMVFTFKSNTTRVGTGIGGQKETVTCNHFSICTISKTVQHSFLRLLFNLNFLRFKKFVLL